MKQRKLFLLLLMLALLLCACGPVAEPGESADPASSQNITPSPSPSEALPAETPAQSPTAYSFGDIEKLMRTELDREDLAVMEVRDAGPYTVVQYTYMPVPEGGPQTSRFAWFERADGSITDIGAMDAYVRFHLDDETGLLTAQTSGLDTNSGLGWLFPQITRVEAGTANAEQYIPYFMPVEETWQHGYRTHESGKPHLLDQLVLGEQSFWIRTRPDGWPYGNSVPSPEIQIENSGGVATITISDVQPAEGFVIPEDPRLLSLEQTGLDIVLRMDIGQAQRYSMTSLEESPVPLEEEGYAITAFSYVEGDFPLDYPEGW